MSVQRAGTDIGALRELEVFLLVEGFRPSELKRTLVMGGTTRWHFPVTRHARCAPPVSTIRRRRSRPASPGTFGKFPGTVPSVFIMNYVQAHHLDLDFYDRFFQPGAYLRTHAEHMQRWHGEQQGG